MRTIHRAIAEEILHSRTTPQTILDVGCGDGSFTRTLAALLPHAAVTAMDATTASFPSSANLSFVRGKAESMPFAASSFDLVIAALSLHHWEAKEKGLREAFRVLKRGGRLVIGDPLLEDWMRHLALGFLMQKADGGSFTDEKTIREYLRAAGFERMDIRLVPRTMRSLYLITAEKPAS